MGEMYMDKLDYVMKKKCGYWGWRSLIYLARNDTEALTRFLQREDFAEIIMTLNMQCRFRMKCLMKDVSGEDAVNSHDLKPGLQMELYRYLVELAKKIIFDDCLDLLQYASWMEGAAKLKEIPDECDEEVKE